MCRCDGLCSAQLSKSDECSKFGKVASLNEEPKVQLPLPLLVVLTFAAENGNIEQNVQTPNDALIKISSSSDVIQETRNKTLTRWRLLGDCDFGSR